MSTDFIPIKQIIETRKGGFIGVCFKESDLSAGTGQNGDWTKKTFTLQDESADLEITCWNDDTKKFHLGGKFEVLGLFWKQYNNNWGANVGKYSQIKLVGNVEVNQTTTTIFNTDESVTFWTIKIWYSKSRRINCSITDTKNLVSFFIFVTYSSHTSSFSFFHFFSL